MSGNRWIFFFFFSISSTTFRQAGLNKGLLDLRTIETKALSLTDRVLRSKVFETVAGTSGEVALPDLPLLDPSVEETRNNKGKWILEEERDCVGHKSISCPDDLTLLNHRNSQAISVSGHESI